MQGILSLVLIIAPLVFQIIYGRKGIGEDIKLNFGTVCLISFSGQILFTIISIFITGNLLQKKGIHCGMPIVGIIGLSIFFTFILFVTILIQYFIKKSYEKK